MRIIKRENDKSIGRLNIVKDSRMDSLKLINFLVKIESKYKVKISTSKLSIKKNQLRDIWGDKKKSMKTKKPQL